MNRFPLLIALLCVAVFGATGTRSSGAPPADTGQGTGDRFRARLVDVTAFQNVDGPRTFRRAETAVAIADATPPINV